MNTLISLLFSYYMLRLIGIVFGLWIFKIGMKKFLKINLDYKKIAIWLYKTIKSCFEAMFDTINKF